MAGGWRADVALGFLLYETQREVAPAETVLRLGLAGPDHQEAGEMLMHVMALERQSQELVRFCGAEERRQDTPRLHLIAAGAETWRRLWPQATEQVRRALEMEPDDPTDLLTLAVLVLKADGGPKSLAEAGGLFTKAERGLALVPTSDPGWEEYRVSHAYYLALRGDAEAARRELKTVAASDPHDQGATAGLRLLGKG